MTAFCILKFTNIRLFTLVLGELLEIGVDESVDVTVHNGVDITVLVAGSRILCESVGHEYVASDLATPFDVCLVTLDVLDLLKVLTDLDLHELCLKHLESGLLVLELASLGLTAYNDTGRLMHDTDSGVGFVNVLTTRTTRTVSSDFEILVSELDLGYVFKLRHNLYGREGCVTSSR